VAAVKSRFRLKLLVIVLITMLTLIVGGGVWIIDLLGNATRVSNQMMEGLSKNDFQKVSTVIQCQDCEGRIREKWGLIVVQLGNLRSWRFRQARVVQEWKPDAHDRIISDPFFHRFEVEYEVDFDHVRGEKIVVSLVRQRGQFRVLDVSWTRVISIPY
jgi:hypothetical protein